MSGSVVLDVDVLVVGGGMAGSIAALAARASGARVALVRRSPGATALSSGAIRVAPDTWAAANEPFGSRLCTLAAARRIAATRPGHPYARVGEGLDRLEEALAFAAGELRELLGPPGVRPLFLATPCGVVLSCALAQRSMLAGDLASLRGTLAVVGVRGHLGFDAALVAGALSRCAALAEGARAIEIDLFMDEAMATSRPHELARALEVPGAAEEAGRRLRSALPAGAAVALLPPILGVAPGARVPERVAQSAGLPVAEALADVPSVPGLRLDSALQRRLSAAGVQLLEGAAVAAGLPGSTCSVGARGVSAPAWVLATGRFTGGGIVRRGRLEETLLGLPVDILAPGHGRVDPACPSASSTVRDRRALQPLLAAGVAVDERLRPLGERGDPAHPRLFAAGDVISGHEVGDGTGLGVAVLTGYLAGRNAAVGP